MTAPTVGTLALTFLSHRADHPDAAAALADLRALIARVEQAERERDRLRSDLKEMQERWAASEKTGDHYVAEYRAVRAKLETAEEERGLHWDRAHKLGQECAALRADVARLRDALTRVVGISWSAGSLAFEDAISAARAALERSDSAATADNRSAQGGK